MCTVTYIPLKENEFALTSNRDEKSFRNATELILKQIEFHQMIYPEDPLAKGSWIGISEMGISICLLNGAFQKHERKSFYQKSRGIILIELLQSIHYKNSLDKFDLREIEPFTMIIVDQSQNKNKLIEFIWDGNKKYIQELNSENPYLWSSVTLYSKEEIEFKKKLFNEKIKYIFDKADIFTFHHSSNNRLKRDSKELLPITISTTQIIGNPDELVIQHVDLINSKTFWNSFNLTQPFYV